ncbi:MAG TPA: hypothetical protein VGM03_22485 [Phycisphaerae bacterium]
MGERILIFERHPLSRRSAIFEESDNAAWLYLTDPDDLRPIRDVWVFNRIEAPERNELQRYASEPPPAAAGFAGPDALCRDAEQHAWSLRWSPDGAAVALLKDGAPAAFVSAKDERGVSVNLLRDGPWGHPWDAQAYAALFVTQ